MIADYKNPDPTYTSSPIQFWRYFADVKNISNMYPYGKSYGTNAIYNATDDYRYGFNGMEKEKNISPSGNTFDFGARVYDSEFPTFLSRDPKENILPFQSSYAFAGSNPINYIDLNGELVHLPANPEQAAIVEKAQITSNYELKLDGLNSDRLKLTATTFSWAIRSELLRENKEQINQFFNEFIKNPDILKLQLINSETSIVELSTDKKDVGTEVTKYNSLQEQTIVTDSTEFQIVTPITGLNKKLGVFVMQVKNLKHN